MRVLLTGGGTAGHINPAIAIANYIKEKEKDIHDWYRIILHRLITICKVMSSKYTRSKVRKSLPKDFSYIIEELIHEDYLQVLPNKQGQLVESKKEGPALA